MLSVPDFVSKLCHFSFCLIHVLVKLLKSGMERLGLTTLCNCKRTFARGNGGWSSRAKGDGGQNVCEGMFARSDLRGHCGLGIQLSYVSP